MRKAMSGTTRREIIKELRKKYGRAGRVYRQSLIDQVVEILGYHRKAAIRALGGNNRAKASANRVQGRPRSYDPQKLGVPLKQIWFAADQPCSRRLAALLPEWLPAYESDHRRLDPDLREQLLRASPRTLDRLLGPHRAQQRRRARTRPGSLLRQEIPIRGRWEESESGPGWLEVDTVALCGGCLDDRHLWMLDAVDIRTDWTEVRGLENRSQEATLRQLADLEKGLPFALKGLDCDNGGEFLNHHLYRHLLERQQPVLFTRSRPYRKNDNAHVEQRNWTHVRQYFGYERYDNPAVTPLINALCKGALSRMNNHWLPTQKLESKRREGSRIVREYGPVRTPYARLMDSPQVEAKQKERLRLEHASDNPFELRRQIARALKQIEAMRLLTA
jgi:hypothetical protein